MERDPVVLLFSDLEGFGDLIDDLGDEEAALRRRSHLRLVREASGPAPVRNLGDGLLAVLGDADSALACASAIQYAAARHNRRDPERPLAVRVAMHTGHAVDDEEDLFQPSVRTVERLCRATDAGQVLLTRAVAGPAGPHLVLNEHKPLKIGGKKVEIAELVWMPAQPPIPAALCLAGVIELCGRSSELNTLEAVWTKANGRPFLALVEGDAGMGTSRLAAELAQRAHASGAGVLYGACDPHQPRPLGPLLSALKTYLDGCAPQTLNDHARALDLDPQTLVSRFRNPDAGAPSSEESTVCALLDELSLLWPLLVVIDDLHWADEHTLAVLHRLGHDASGPPFAVVAAMSDQWLSATCPAATALGRLRALDGFESVHVRGLSAEDTHRLLVAAGAPDNDKLTDRLSEFASGNPWFALELRRELAAAPEAQDTAAQTLPGGPRELVATRVARLSDPARAALEELATQDMWVSDTVLAERLGLDASDISSAVDEGRAAGLVVSSDAGHAVSHPLVRSLVLEVRTPAETSRARASEDTESGADQTEVEVVQHPPAAPAIQILPAQRDTEPAARNGSSPSVLTIPTPQGAIEDAWQRWASGNAAEATELVDQEWRSANEADDPRRGFTAAANLALLRLSVVDPLSARASCLREIAKSRSGTLPAQRRLLLDLVAACDMLTGRRDEALRISTEAGTAGRLHLSPIAVALGDGEFDEASRLYDELDLESVPTGARFVFHRIGARARGMSGRPDLERALLERVLSDVDGSASPGAVVLNADVAIVAADAGDLSSARSHLLSALQVVVEGGDWQGTGGRVALAEAVIESAAGRPDEAGPAYRDALQSFRRYSLRMDEVETLHRWSSTLATAGRRAEADEKLREAQASCKDNALGEPWALGAALHTRSEVTA